MLRSLSPAAIFFKNITNSFALCVQNIKQFCHCEYRKACGNPFLLFKRIKSFCARAARAPYFCTDRNREKSRRTPFQLGFRTFPNDQRDKLPFGNLYYIEIRYVPINNVKKAYTEKDLKICEKLLRDNAEQFTGCYRDNLKIIL